MHKKQKFTKSNFAFLCDNFFRVQLHNILALLLFFFVENLTLADELQKQSIQVLSSTSNIWFTTIYIHNKRVLFFVICITGENAAEDFLSKKEFFDQLKSSAFIFFLSNSLK